MSNAKETTLKVLRGIADRQKRCREYYLTGIEKITQNAVHNMSWYAKDIYVGQYMEKEYIAISHIISNHINEMEESLIPALEDKLKEYDYFLLQPNNLRLKSSCEVTQMTSTWEYECQLNIRSEIQGFINALQNQK